MRLAAAAERGIWGLIRAAIATGGWQRRVAEAIADELRPPVKRGPREPQLLLWTEQENAPPLPWRIPGGHQVKCVALRCTLTAAECVRRQVKTDVQRTQQTSRGQGTDHPHCDSRTCDQGRTIRAALDPDAIVQWRGAGPGGRFDRERSRGVTSVQEAARAQLERVGLLRDVPTVDGCPVPVESEG